MKRSEINAIIREARACFERHGWKLPPKPRWDVTDFGLSKFNEFGLLLLNLAEEPEYCEKLMYARKNQQTPLHCHRQKKEDIISRNGELLVEVWKGNPDPEAEKTQIPIRVNGEPIAIENGGQLILKAGERITLFPGYYHAFYPVTDDCIIGEVSTANDDANDNFFLNPEVGRYPDVEEDEAAEIRLLSDY
ncbi:MAG: D-lyxose/D-mannose family sugar isomerase [Opitutaceae bacterium]|nr:D-lyxose/D-mannose family sugar isomerase [Opitutaceae bacterium]